MVQLLDLNYQNGSMTCGDVTNCTTTNRNYFACCDANITNTLSIQLLQVTNTTEVYGKTLFPTNIQQKECYLYNTQMNLNVNCIISAK